MTPTQSDVLDAFDSLGGKVERPMALTRRLEELGFDPAAVAAAVNDAIKAGKLVLTDRGGISRT